MLQIFDKQFKSLLPAQQIQTRIQTVCRDIELRYQNSRPLFIAILNGAFMFASDVLKNISIDCEITFVKLQSYVGDQSTGKVKTMIGLDKNLAGRDVIILEDIVDTGHTLAQLLPALEAQLPKSVAVFTLLLKPEALQHPLKLDYVGFEIGN